jgi:hypothetical protein
MGQPVNPNCIRSADRRETDCRPFVSLNLDFEVRCIGPGTPRARVRGTPLKSGRRESNPRSKLGKLVFCL